jgi:hypothetical protein
MREGKKHYAKEILRGGQKTFIPPVSFLGIRWGAMAPPSPWSIRIISLRENVKLNLVAQPVAGKILISKSLGVDDGSVRLPLTSWKSSAFSPRAARADVTVGCGNSTTALALKGVFESALTRPWKAALPPWRATLQALVRDTGVNTSNPGLKRRAQSVSPPGG